jgi:hypothetical protein
MTGGSRSGSAIRTSNPNTQREFVDLRVRASVGGTPRQMTVSVSARPSRNDAAAPGWERSSSRANARSSASARSASLLR